MVLVRHVSPADRAQWEPLWAGYNSFYERVLPDAISEVSWRRFFDSDEPVFAAVAERDGRLLGLVHYLYHRSTTMIEPVCYLQDLFTAPDARGAGVGRALIEFVYQVAANDGATRVYWLTHEANPARHLYDQVATLTPFRRYVKDIG